MNSGNSNWEVIFHHQAKEEYLAAKRWYATEAGQELAESFEHELDDAIRRIALQPESWPFFRAPYRFVRLHRFPYVVYFRTLDESRVLVVAVAHSRRRPEYWIRRDHP